MKNQNEMLADVFEAIEHLRFFKPIYNQVLKDTKSHDEAFRAVKWLYDNISEEIRASLGQPSKPWEV